MANANMRETENATSAVRNHPLITVSTPVTLYTALSLPHAWSERDVPIATMNVTYVVESGSFNEVANETTALATMRFTEARNRSKDGIFPSIEGAQL